MQSKSNLKIIYIVASLSVLILMIIATIYVRNDNETESNKELEIVNSIESEQDYVAKYKIEYVIDWSQQTHPQTFPNGAHVSPIVVVAHMEENNLFTSNKLASDGMEIMAETGATQVLSAEIEDSIGILNSSPSIGQVINAPGRDILEIELNQDHPLISAVSMLAPSPDWFIAASNINLFTDGQWLNEIEVNMRAYDAGTDNGANFVSDNSDTDPADIIQAPIDQVFKDANSENIFATLKLIRQE